MKIAIIWLLLVGSAYAQSTLPHPLPHTFGTFKELPHGFQTVPQPFGRKDTLQELQALAPVGVPPELGTMPGPPPTVEPANWVITENMTVMHAIHVASDQHIACANNLIVIYNPNTTDAPGHEHSTFIFDNVSNASLSNCTLQMAGNAVHASYSFAAEFTFPVLIRNGSSNVTIQGNRFQGWQGDAGVEIYSKAGVAPSSHITIDSNTFTGGGLYGPVAVSAVDSVISNNVLRRCSLGIEPDGNGQVDRNILFVNNDVQDPRTGAAYFLNPMVGVTDTPGFDFGSVVFRNNHVGPGFHIRKGAGYAARQPIFE
jgi:hypothetical protein